MRCGLGRGLRQRRHHFLHLRGELPDLLRVGRSRALQLRDLLIQQIELRGGALHLLAREAGLHDAHDLVEIVEDQFANREPGNGHESPP